MIDKMTRYSFVLLSSGRDRFLEELQELGLVDIKRAVRPVDEESAALLAAIEERKKLVSEIENRRNARLDELEAEADGLEEEAFRMEVWGDWDRDKLAATGIPLHFYSVRSKDFEAAADSLDAYAVVVAGENDGKTCFVVAGDNEGFPFKEMPAPGTDLAGARALAAAKKAEAEELQNQLEARKAELPELRRALKDDEDALARHLASASGENAAEGSLVVFEGFAPSENDDSLGKAFDSMDLVWYRDKATVEDDPPIKFRNNRFVRMFEVLTDMYGRPSYNGFDPTPFIAVFFMLFFAFCMGDAGYGLILVAMGLGLRGKLGKLAPLVTTLGVATVAIGTLFHTFFSMDMLEWGWVQGSGLDRIMLPSKIAGYDGTMVLALVVGIVHLCLAMVVKTINATRNNGFFGSLGTWGWTLLIVGGVIVGVFALAGVIDEGLTKIIIIVIGVLSAAGIFLINDIHRNPLLNISSGLWETYNTVTGLLGDVLSYLRLYALGLAGSMLGKAFNDIGLMILGDGSALKAWIPFILIVLIGHALNVAMCVLGAFVHPLRLNFLEFFKNSGYEASGRSYNPLKK